MNHVALQLVVPASDDQVDARPVTPSLDDPNGAYEIRSGEAPKIFGAREMLQLGRALYEAGYQPLRVELRDARFNELEPAVQDWLSPQVVDGLVQPGLPVETVQRLIPRIFVAWLELLSPSRDTVRVFRTGRVETRPASEKLFVEQLQMAWPKVRRA